MTSIEKLIFLRNMCDTGPFYFTSKIYEYVFNDLAYYEIRKAKNVRTIDITVVHRIDSLTY